MVAGSSLCVPRRRNVAGEKTDEREGEVEKDSADADPVAIALASSSSAICQIQLRCLHNFV
ncbi:hypothetical protein Dimus_012012 [Dionaea muscipula]